MVRASNERSKTFMAGCAIWVVFCIFLVVSDFGVAAVFGSVLLSIYVFGLRDKFSNEQTASAYSVFNRDGKGIVGGFTATQLDNQLRGSMNVSDSSNDPIRGEVAVARGERNVPNPGVSNEARLQRRKAAAAAAERRLQSTKDNSL